MHPAMVKVLAAEHVRDMLVRAEKTQRVSAARHARKAYRAWRPARASTVSASPVSASTVSASAVPASPCQPAPAR
ncbi:MAG: hypothetical protein QOJ73_2102 [Streptosporangiaceae bacterium]|jgi:hypothetical protein|nr:hypothetical protein [Streptosporangiaceae bacterium]